MKENRQALIIYDGICNLCNSYVRFLMDKDKKDLFRFVPLQSEEGEEVGKTYNVSGIGKDTVVLIKNDQVYFRSAAVFRIFRMLGGWWKIPGIAGYIIPSFIADYFYNVVARNRYKWFGVIDI